MKRPEINIVIWLFLLLGCEEAIDKEPQGNDEPLLVVEGIMTNELKRHKIKLSKTFTKLNDTPPPVTDALVIVNDGDQNHFLTHDPDEPGTYLTDSIRAVFGKVYTLYILENGEEHFAQATSTFGTPLPDLTYQESGDRLQYLFADSVVSMTEVQITWEETDSTGTLSQKEIHAYYYKLDVIAVNAILPPDKEELFFPHGSTIFRRKYSLTRDHQAFLRSYLNEVDWRGGAFDVAAGNVLTNISGSAVGYFAVSMVDTDTTYIE